MKSVGFIAPDRQYRVVIEVKALNAMEKVCQRADPDETGGILIGYYSSDRSTAVIVEATPPPADSASAHSWFVRGVAGLADLLQRRWRARTSTHYIGEWHFHPAPHVSPSPDDFEAMNDISASPTYQCLEPILLIWGRRRDTKSLRPCRVFVCPKDATGVELEIES